MGCHTGAKGMIQAEEVADATLTPTKNGLPILYSPINSLTVSPTIRTAASMLGVGLEE
ncbi:hypothetical protein D9M68_376390 [compost metagenome]